MTARKEHPHAWVFREIADGAQLSDFECKLENLNGWGSVSDFVGFVLHPEIWQVRRKQKMHRIGEFTFPAPMTKAPKYGDYYWVAAVTGKPAKLTWHNAPFDLVGLNIGICHATKEAADPHSKALAAIARGEPV